MKTVVLIIVWAAILSIIGQFAIEVWKLFRNGRKSGDLSPKGFHDRFDALEQKVDAMRLGQANMKVDLKEVKQTVQPDEEKTPAV